ncbi:MAG TPA: zf-HC2 domain-containing protein [Pyrinomonadaceae bacterium]|jgi:hypothetical protein|nr:zf-HC2 domain-containing protein [Pyrinomonadaceae bacterium]
MKEVNTPNCGREDALVAFLYGELNEDESRTFRAHLHDCAACSKELANFQEVRESVVAWRNESLGGVISPSMAGASLSETTSEKPSALAALRQFFQLSPLWMKASVAFASILFCLLAGLAIARLRETPPTVIVADHSAISEEQINARVQAEVKRKVQEEIERLKNSTEPQPRSTIAVKNAAPNSERRTLGRVSVASNNPIQKARRPLSKTEREQLAADLRLVTAANESELDLLDDGINQ